jgi:hypothetical protein
MSTPISLIVDYVAALFRSPEAAMAHIQDPDGAMNNAGLHNVTAAQLNAVAATAAPAGVMLGGGDPVVGLQRAVSDHHNFASPFSPQTSFAPQTQTEFASRNNTDLLSHNDIASPHAGENVQQGGVNLDFSDMTFGDRTENTATDGSVINTGNAGDIDATNVEGDRNVVGDHNNANTGNIGGGSNVNVGEDNKIDDRGDVTAGGDVIKDNHGPVINDVDMSGGNASGGHGGGGLIGVGNDGGNATGGSGGGIAIGGDTTQVLGDQTNVDVGGDVSGSGGIDASHTDDHSSVDSHDNNSSVDSHDATVETNVDVHNSVF